jgi:Legionella pneumophila major outer membrane protein precursor
MEDMVMGLSRSVACGSLKTIRQGILAVLLAALISLEIPDVSVVRAQEVPGLYANAQGVTGNSSWVSQLTNPFASLFVGQQDVFPANRPQGFSFTVEGLYMNLRSDAQVLGQNITTTTTTYLGSTTATSSEPGNFQSVKPGRVRGLRVGLGYAVEDWDARVLYSKFRAEPESGQAGPSRTNFTAATYSGISTGGTTTSVNPFAATGPLVPLNNYQAEAGFNANVWDFQAGYSIRLGQFSTARIFGGISYVETENTLDGTGDLSAGGSLSVNRKTTYRAWGPKVGVDLNCPLGRSGLSLRGSGALGGLFGTRKITSNNNVLASLEDSNRQTTTSLEGEAGIGYSFPSMELTLGYRVERFSVNNISFVDVGASLASGTTVRTGNDAAVQYLEGGFLRLDVKL